MSATSLDTCSFCGKQKDQVGKLIVSEDVAICNECVRLCQDLLKDDSVSPSSVRHCQDPRELKTFLDQYVIGQDRAKIMLSVAIVNHYKRIYAGEAAPDINKTNILLIGSTGSGKTLLAKSAAKFLDIPFVITDATSITEAGYVGDDVETLISRLYAAANGDVEKTQRGIVFIDEIDKIARKSEGASVTRDVSGEGVQQALLKLVEGTVCRIFPQAARKHPAGDMVEIDTTNILFIGGGAFVGLDRIVANRVRGSAMGFAGKVASSGTVDLEALIPDDLVRFGMIPEFVGRFPSVVSLDMLTRADMLAILTGVKNNLIDQYRWIFAQDGVELEFTPASLDSIVDRAMTANTGARSLQTILERCLLPYMYELRNYADQGQKVLRIDQDAINNIA